MMINSGVSKGQEVLDASLGKTITALRLGDDDALHFSFADGSAMKLRDDLQHCCEMRFMRTDDDLSQYVGATLIGVEVKDVSVKEESEWFVHEIQFLDVKTDRGVFTIASHNGYYCGFNIVSERE